MNNRTVFIDRCDESGNLPVIVASGKSLVGTEYREAIKYAPRETEIMAIKLDATGEIILFFWEGGHWRSELESEDTHCYFNYGSPEDSPEVMWLKKHRTLIFQ